MRARRPGMSTDFRLALLMLARTRETRNYKRKEIQFAIDENSWLTSSRFVCDNVTELWDAPALPLPSLLIISSQQDFASSVSVVCHRHVAVEVRRSALFLFSCGLCYQRIPYVPIGKSMLLKTKTVSPHDASESSPLPRVQKPESGIGIEPTSKA